jgi:hypothetical protein
MLQGAEDLLESVYVVGVHGRIKLQL